MSTCANCKFMVGDRCRRYPPQVTVTHERDDGGLSWERAGTWPAVKPSDWCGEYVERGNP